MNDSNRDLLLLSKVDLLSPEEMAREVHQLNALLLHAETWESFCVANEILDINRGRIIQKPAKMKKVIGRKKSKPFIFVQNKN